MFRILFSMAVLAGWCWFLEEHTVPPTQPGFIVPTFLVWLIVFGIGGTFPDKVRVEVPVEKIVYRDRNAPAPPVVYFSGLHNMAQTVFFSPEPMRPRSVEAPVS